jgi:predicted kinase
MRLNADEWVAAHFSDVEQPNNWDKCFSTAVTAIWKEAEVHLRNGKDVILDLGFWSKESRDDARRRAAECGAEFKHYYITAPDEVLLERIRQRSGSIAERNLRDYYELKKGFEEPNGEDVILIA